MEIWPMINDNGWRRVTWEEYEAFTGEKKLWGPTHGMALLQKYLQPLRWC